jgi:hypothetical protein
MVRNRREVVGGAVGTGVGAEDPGHRSRTIEVHAPDARMRMWRAHHGGVHLPRKVEIIGEAPAPVSRR